MTDTEERIQKLQKLLDRVLARDDDEPRSESPGDAPTIEEMKSEGDEKLATGAAGEDTTAEVEVPHRKAKTDAKEDAKEAAKEAAKDAVDAPSALESRSRLVAAPTPPESQGTLEVTEADLIPDSEAPDGPESAVPLVRRSRTAHELSSDELISDGRISLDDALPISSRSLIEEHAPTTLDDDVGSEEVESSELLEEEPASSRRPIAIPEDEHSAPRHTPPPESGKQVAAPSLADSETTGVRKSSLPPALPVTALAPVLTPDVVHAPLPENANVAHFEGTMETPRPATFGELLDLALDL